MDDEAAFLAAMRAAPASRLTRHVYADWLEERGDPRHELVRVCEAMRAVPVWSDDYWAWKARRNALWTQFPIEWLEATGYDGSDYDPIFRDGVPDGVRERWRLIREFTERWHGVSVPDVGGQRDVIASEEARLGLTLPESVREFVAFAHDMNDQGTGAQSREDTPSMFHCAYYDLGLLNWNPALSLIYHTLDNTVVGVAREDFSEADPRTRWYRESGQYSDANHASEHWFNEPSLSLSIFRGLFTELPFAGFMHSILADVQTFVTKVAADFSTHAPFDDANVYESRELIVFVRGPRMEWGSSPTVHRVYVIVRRAIPFDSIPDYVLGTDERHTTSGGVLVPISAQQDWAESVRLRGNHPPRWVSVRRRQENKQLQAEREAEALRNPPEPVMFPASYWERQARPDAPEATDSDDIPF